MTRFPLLSRFALSTVSAGLFAAGLVVLGPAHPTQAAVGDSGGNSQILIGLDDDNINNIAVQARRGSEPVPESRRRYCRRAG